jgi:N-acetylglucosamine-6-sulfatase
LQSVFNWSRTHPWRRALLAAALAAACLAAAGCGGESPARFGISLLPSSTRARSRLVATPRRPNIVFVLTDDLSLDLLRYMPHVLAMERHGLTFRDYFVSDSLCCPSRASIFTGKYIHNTHVLDNIGRNGGFRAFYRRHEELHTFALALQRLGYLTAIMGKYLNGYLTDTGLHKHDGASADVPGGYVPPGWNEWSVAGWGYPEFNYKLNQGGVLYQFGHQSDDYLTDVLADKGTQFIDAAARRHQPFFLELSTFAPHAPYTPAPRNRHDFPGLKAPRPPNFDRLPTNAPLWLSHHPPLGRSELRLINRVFRRRAQSVEAVDQMIAEIEATLRAKGLANDTYMIFSSDNGLHTGEYRLMPGKLTAFDTDIHVPLVVTGPGVRPGSSSTAMAENVDLARTFVAIGGGRMHGDGHNLLPLFHGRTPADWRNAALIEHHAPLITTLDPDFQQPTSGRPTTYEAMRTHGYLYVEYADGEVEFYDLRRDPFELHNVAGSLSLQELSQLHAELAAMRRCRGRGCWSATHVARLPGPW